MKDFVAIDFETANSERSSVCSVGVVIVRDGRIEDSFYSLIRPEPNYYNSWCTQVHGLTQADTDGAYIFPIVWEQIEPLIEGLPLVAHNKAFDESRFSRLSVRLSQLRVSLYLSGCSSCFWK